MKIAVFSMALALALAGCGRPEPAAPAPQAQQTRPPEKTTDQASRELSDASLTQIVREALKSESSLDARRIEVQNRDGVVALQGSVTSEEQREKAGRIVGSVGGVKTVDNRLTVDEGASTGTTAELPK